MATVIGDSGVWREIAESIWSLSSKVRSPSDIEPLLAHLRKMYQPSVNRKQTEIAQRVQFKENQIATFRAERGFVRALLNWFKILGCRSDITRLRAEERQHIAALSADIQRLERLLDSPELAGARAELAVIAQLQRLSAEHTILNDVHLRATRYIHFRGVPLQSAQVDHLVLSPAGVFVIETKQWSSRFADSGHYHDPFDQVNRAAYLCYDLLRERFGKIRVRSIIACAGSLLTAPANSYVKVLRVAELNNYIAYFRHRELMPDQLQSLREFFEE
ncbi:MAG: nuclease-related domain-containing protein [Opitutaceae bacterium]